MADSSLRLEVVDPDGLVFEGDVQMAVAPAAYGELGVLPNHAPLVCQLKIGKIRAQTLNGGWVTIAVAEGFMKVQANKIIVLADAAELSSEIDVARAQRALDRATERLAMCKEGRVPPGEDIDAFKEALALARAKNRLKVVHKD